MDCTASQLRKTMADWVGGADLRGSETQRWLWTKAVAKVGETPSLTRDSVEKHARDARDEQASCTVPSLAPPPQAVPQHSKEVCLAWVNT